MAEIAQHNNRTNRRRNSGPAPRMDMTPMVDLAFLLLTFFVLTTVPGSKPKCMVLTFPASGESLHFKKGITFLLSGNDRIFYYEGQLKPDTRLAELSFSVQDQRNLHAFLLEKNKPLQDRIRTLDQQHKSQQLTEEDFKRLVRECKADNTAYTYLVKTDDKATYKNVIDVVDELNINVVGKYCVADIMPQELELLKETQRLSYHP